MDRTNKQVSVARVLNENHNEIVEIGEFMTG